MLRRETWGPDLQIAYDRDALGIEKYSTAMAVERQEGRQEGEMKGFIGEFIFRGKLGPKSLQRIKRNQPDEGWIGEIWKAREAEMAELESDEEEEEIPNGRTLADFIAYLGAEGMIGKEEEE
jgi:hypothetical protein